MTSVDRKFGTSQSVPRKEDVRFLTGQGRYLDDVAPEGALHAVFLRSPVGARRDRAGSTSPRRAAMPGVLGGLHRGGPRGQAARTRSTSRR